MIAKFLTTVNVREGPSTSTDIVAKYNKDETVKYDNLIENEGKLWITYLGSSGNRRYCCARDDDGEWYIKLKNPSAPISSFSPSSSYSRSLSYSPSFSSSPSFPTSPTSITPSVSMYQKSSKHEAVRKSGCCFLCCCYLGGLNNINEADDCWYWASGSGKVDKNDAYVNVEKHGLGTEIANIYGRERREGKIVKGNNHFYVIDGAREIYNSMGIGWGH